MQIQQSLHLAGAGWEAGAPQSLDGAQFVLVFGDIDSLSGGPVLSDVRAAYPDAHLVGCSTAGEILDERVRNGSVSVTAVRFDRARVETAEAELGPDDDSADLGRRLANALEHDELRHVFVLSDGLEVNGSELVKGLAESVPPGVGVTGGLSGDGERFERTLVVGRSEPRARTVAALGFYGESLRIGSASLGGCDPLGPERMVTRSKANVLYELDNQPALDVYRRYLGDATKDLPASALLYPLALRTKEGELQVVRTVLAIDEDERSMTFAGDLPEGTFVQLTRATRDRLVDGAESAARAVNDFMKDSPPELAILISCIGRKMVLRQRVEEEVEAVRAIVGDGARLAGFYSYGEIAPHRPTERAELHNQSMTITGFSEAA